MGFRYNSRFGFTPYIYMVLFSSLFSQTEFHGQANVFLAVSNPSTDITVQYLPELTLSNTNLSLDISPILSVSDRDELTTSLESYRAWLRYTTTFWEWKLGLQRIDFGPAKLLRTLQWFDQLDPRDPTHQTTGVWALKGRYASLTNRTFTVWTLYGNTKRKGMDLQPSDAAFPEFGGRYVMPVGSGEFGLTTHWRRLDSSDPEKQPGEFRIGLDGYGEYNAGLWFESTASFFSESTPSLQALYFLTVGTDYTWLLGNGLYTAFEHMTIHSVANQTTTSGVYGILASYPLSWLDTANIYFLDIPDSQFTMAYLSWQRTLDNFIILIGGYAPSGLTGASLFPSAMNVPGRSGFQLMITFNH